MNTVIAQGVKKLFNVDTDVVLTRPEPKFGDYATNVALQLAKPLGKNPRDIAQMLAAELQTYKDFANVTVAGPGFINIHLSSEALLDGLAVQPKPLREGQVAVIETNNPNPFKPMHIGHAYNATLADTIANLFAASGAEVKRVSYHGDVGAHVGKSMWALLRYCKGDASRLSEVPPAKRNEFMGTMYAEGAKAAKEDEAAAAEIGLLSQQSFDREEPLYAEIYNTVFEWSFQEIDRTVTRLGNVPTERRYLESEADPIGVATVRENVPTVFQESKGALVFEGSKYGAFDNAFVSSSGRGLYAARDLGLIQLKAKDYPTLESSVIVTGGEQAAYFRGVIAATEQALPELKGKIINYPTGLVKLTTGKMSSRTGDVVTVDWLFEEVTKAIEARGGEATDEIVAGALRYQFLRVKIGSDVIFDVNEAVSLTGNTGSYLQYAHARAKSILRKATPEQALQIVHEEDRGLVRKLGEYSEVVTVALRTLEPHHICTYLFELAQEFNRYYEINQVVGSEHEAHRAALVAAYARTLETGLALLGIQAPERM